MQRARIIHVSVAIALAAPALALALRAARDALGADPVEALLHETGEWALRLLLATLAVTPLRRALGWAWLAPYRRTFGLAAFGYACLHLATYVGIDLFFDWAVLLEDLTERPYIMAGFGAFLCLVPLAVTSTRGWMRRLGRRWTTLHRLIYPAAVLAVIHFLWLVKADLREPSIYAGVLAVLLGSRAIAGRLPGARARRASTP